MNTGAVPYAVYMERAIELAQGARGTTSPNPAVGAVIVKDGVVLGEGWTSPPGGPHAEVVALKRAGAEAAGATLYTTMEPCCMWGRTPPCTDALADAGIAEVHSATLDPNPKVFGKGLEALRIWGSRPPLELVRTKLWSCARLSQSTLGQGYPSLLLSSPPAWMVRSQPSPAPPAGSPAKPLGRMSTNCAVGAML